MSNQQLPSNNQSQNLEYTVVRRRFSVSKAAIAASVCVAIASGLSIWNKYTQPQATEKLNPKTKLEIVAPVDRSAHILTLSSGSKVLTGADGFVHCKNFKALSSPDQIEVITGGNLTPRATNYCGVPVQVK